MVLPGPALCRLWGRAHGRFLGSYYSPWFLRNSLMAPVCAAESFKFIPPSPWKGTCSSMTAVSLEHWQMKIMLLCVSWPAHILCFSTWLHVLLGRFLTHSPKFSLKGWACWSHPSALRTQLENHTLSAFSNLGSHTSCPGIFLGPVGSLLSFLPVELTFHLLVFAVVLG